MKKIYSLFCTLLLTGVTAFSQTYLLKSEISPIESSRDSRFAVQATVMDNDTWCHISWPQPSNTYQELAYDDGSAEDFFLWADPGNMNANKFHPNFYPYMITGGSIYVGDSTFPGPFLGTSFKVFIFDDDGTDGLPGTALDSIDITVNNYGWVKFEGFTTTLTDGDFYLAMKQTAHSPNTAPVGVDMENPTYFKSYMYLIQSQSWVLSPVQDFMIRAWVTGYTDNSRNIDYFQLARFSGFYPCGTALQGYTTVLDTIYNSAYDDYAWNSLPAGSYAYGVKTHFTDGEWSDYDISNIVTHIALLAGPSCFSQADTGNLPLIICPPLDSTGSVPGNFLGYNLYLDDDFVIFLPSATTSYDPDPQFPVNAVAKLSCVYDLASFGFPGETGESCGSETDYLKIWGSLPPLQEPWISGTFGTNHWMTDGPNWLISSELGNPIPSAEFSQDPVLANYESGLTSYPIRADSMWAGKIYLDFDIRLNSINSTGSEFLLIQVRNWQSQTWENAGSFSNTTGSFGWKSEHLDITQLAMNQIFNVRFLAKGENSAAISGWFIDNIGVYRSCNPPQNFQTSGSPTQSIELQWDSPEGVVIDDQWINWDDGLNYGNSIGAGTDWSVAARWTPDFLSGFEGATVTKIVFFPNETQAVYKVRVWQGDNAETLLADQEVPAPIIGQWNTVTLDTPVPLDITQELWVGYHIDSDSGAPAGVDNGPAIDGYGNMIYLGQWQTLLEVSPDLNYNWNIEAFIDVATSADSSVEYAIYRSDDYLPFYLRDKTYQNFYLDDSAICYHPGEFHAYKISAIYFTENEICESDFSNTIGDICEGTGDEIRQESFNIFPNPCNDFLKIESSEVINFISLYNSFGELLFNKKIDESEIEIEIAEYPAGIYLIRVDFGKKEVSAKALVVH